MKGEAGVKGEPVSIIIPCIFVPKYVLMSRSFLGCFLS